MRYYTLPIEKMNLQSSFIKVLKPIEKVREVDVYFSEGVHLKIQTVATEKDNELTYMVNFGKFYIVSRNDENIYSYYLITKNDAQNYYEMIMKEVESRKEKPYKALIEQLNQPN